MKKLAVIIPFGIFLIMVIGFITTHGVGKRYIFNDPDP